MPEKTDNQKQVQDLEGDINKLVTSTYLHRTVIMNVAFDEADEVETLAADLYDRKAAQRRTQEAIAAREAAIYADVCGECDEDTGKPKYTNDGARKAAATELSANDAILVTMRNAVIDADIDIARIERRIAFYNTAINIRRAFLHGAGA